MTVHGPLAHEFRQWRAGGASTPHASVARWIVEWTAGVVAVAALSGCGGGPGHELVLAGTPVEPVAPVVEQPVGRASGWRTEATAADRARLREWRDAWVDALGQVTPGDAAMQPELFAPDRALTQPTPPPGAYRCRTFKLGRKGGKGIPLTAYGWFACSVGIEDGVLRLTKLGGSQRPVGTIFPESDTRAIFLGTMQLADERRPMRYGRDENRDMAGLVERVGARRWRLVLPYPRFESTLDLIELVPAG